MLFNLSFNRTKTDNGFSWKIDGKSEFANAVSLKSIIKDVVSKFSFAEDLELATKFGFSGSSSQGALGSIGTINPDLQELNFSYDSASDSFEFDFDLSEGASLSSITSDITASASNTFSTFKLVHTKTITSGESKSKTSLNLNIAAGLPITDLMDISDDLTFSPEPTLDELKFSMNLLDNGSKSKSDLFSFETGFTQNGNYTLNGVFEKITTGTTVTKYFGGNLSGENIGDLISGGDFPSELEIKDLFLAITSSQTGNGPKTKNTIYGSEMSIDADFDLGSLKVVGSFLKEAKFSFNSLRFTHTAAAIPTTEMSSMNAFLQKINVAPLVTAQTAQANNQTAKVGFPAGYTLQGTLVIGDNLKVIPLHSSFSPTKKASHHNTAEIASPESSAPGTSSSTPTAVGKKFGPITIKSVGIGLSGSDVVLKFNGGLTLGPLTFEFIDLEFGSKITSFDPTVSLEGLGIDLQKPPLSLEGMFSEGSVKIPKKNYATGAVTTEEITAYNGSISIGYKKYNLVAAGSYAKLDNGDSTFFLYGFLGTPMGGPPFFFVTGVAAGFGYNRDFTLPAVDAISTYPLIQPVIPSASGGSQGMDPNQMNEDFLPSVGNFWGAAGVRGTSFKMVETFILLAVRFGKYLEIDILGLSHMQFPKPAEDSSTPPLAKITVGLIARIIPERGIVAINGAIQPGSYVYNPMAKVSGGFAMLSVFATQTDGPWNHAQKGDFVFTLGGYASDYKKPSYYPTAARFQLLWQVSSDLSVKAQAYFAITPKEMMAGGNLAANFNAGGTFSIHAAFVMGANFKIYWKPYHYTAAIYIAMKVSACVSIDLWLVTLHISVGFDVSANLNVWGPSFTGTAAVHVHVLISFTVGVSFGDAPQTPPKLSWQEFSTTLLPDQILTANIASGIVSSQTTSESTTKVVNPKELEVFVNTAIPAGSITGLTPLTVSSTSFGIKPMGNSSSQFSASTLNISISKDAVVMHEAEVDDHFEISVVNNNLPTALWGTASESSSLMNLTSGVQIKAKKPKVGNHKTVPALDYIEIHTPSIDAEELFSYGGGGYTRNT